MLSTMFVDIFLYTVSMAAICRSPLAAALLGSRQELYVDTKMYCSGSCACMLVMCMSPFYIEFSFETNVQQLVGRCLVLVAQFELNLFLSQSSGSMGEGIMQ